MLINPFDAMNDQALADDLFAAAVGERTEGADIILRLMVFAARKLFLPDYKNLFSYCTRHLGFAKGTTSRRLAVVRAAPRFPQLLARLRSGELHLCTAAMIAPELEEGTADELLDAVRGMSQADAKVFLVKTWFPRKARRAAAATCSVVAATPTEVKDAPAEIKDAPSEGKGAPTGIKEAPPGIKDAPTGIKEAPSEVKESPSHVKGATGRPLSVPTATNVLSLFPAESQVDAQPRTSTPLPQVLGRTVVRPLDETTSRFSLVMSDGTLADMRRARELLGGQSDDEILGRALDLLLEKVAPERRHARRQARAAKRAAKPTSKRPPAKAKAKPGFPRRGRLADRDAVAVRDGHQCTHVSPSGRRCEARTFLHHDHVHPYALGGRLTPDNDQLQCPAHNQFRAELTFGKRPKPRPPRGSTVEPLCLTSGL
jgi:hypothetical protein